MRIDWDELLPPKQTGSAEPQQKVVDGRPGMSSLQLMLVRQEEVAVIDPDFD
jgi:hypothetical protein